MLCRYNGKICCSFAAHDSPGYPSFYERLQSQSSCQDTSSCRIRLGKGEAFSDELVYSLGNGYLDPLCTGLAIAILGIGLSPLSRSLSTDLAESGRQVSLMNSDQPNMSRDAQLMLIVPMNVATNALAEVVELLDEGRSAYIWHRLASNHQRFKFISSEAPAPSDIWR